MEFKQWGCYIDEGFWSTQHTHVFVKGGGTTVISIELF